MEGDPERYAKAASAYDWLVPWRYLRQGNRWFVGGYTNVSWNVLDRHLESQPDRLAVYDRGAGVRATYRDLYWQSAGLARWWRDQGVGPGHRMVLYGAPSMTGLVALLASLRLGAVSVFIPETPSLTLLKQRLRESEALWGTAGTGQACQQLRQAGSIRMLGPDGETRDGDTLAQVNAATPGLIDPVPVEANAIGFVVYADHPRPYAYSGMGGLIGWTDGLFSLMEHGPDDRVAIYMPHQGLTHPLLLTLAMMARGAQVTWVWDHLKDAVREQGITKVIVAPRLAEEASEVQSRVDRILVLGHPRGAVPKAREARALWVEAVPHCSAGTYDPVGHNPVIDDGPSSDRTTGRIGAVEASSDPGRAGERAHALFGPNPEILEMWAMEDDDRQVVWVRTKASPEAIMAGIDEAERDHLLVRVVDEFPETVEGRVADQVLSAVSKRQSHLAIDQLANPGIVERMIRVWEQS